MTDLTEDALGRIEAMIAEATPGTWQCGFVSVNEGPSRSNIWSSVERGKQVTPIIHGADARAIVAAVNAAPAFIAEVCALRQQLAAAERQRDELRKAVQPFALHIRDEVPGDQMIDTVAWTADQHRALCAAFAQTERLERRVGK